MQCHDPAEELARRNPTRPAQRIAGLLRRRSASRLEPFERAVTDAVLNSHCLS
jgi:hypothetical protein